MLDAASVVDHAAKQLPWAELVHDALRSYQDVCVAATVVSIPCIIYVYAVAHSGTHLEDGDGYINEETSLYSLGNFTNANTTLCPEMAGLNSQRGATQDVQKTYRLYQLGRIGTSPPLTFYYNPVQVTDVPYG